MNRNLKMTEQQLIEIIYNLSDRATRMRLELIREVLGRTVEAPRWEDYNNDAGAFAEAVKNFALDVNTVEHWNSIIKDYIVEEE